jgi:hypothetical protein
MVRDPLYLQIRSGLDELKDGISFELCANDLLRRLYPTLAPREGGDDAGLDGKVVEAQGNSIQLMCTTSKKFKDIAANLTGSNQTKKRAAKVALVSSRPRKN